MAVTSQQLWDGVTGVSNAGKKKGRGKRVGRKKATDLNRGQRLGVGKQNSSLCNTGIFHLYSVQLNFVLLAWLISVTLNPFLMCYQACTVLISACERYVYIYKQIRRLTVCIYKVCVSVVHFFSKR